MPQIVSVLLGENKQSRQERNTFLWIGFLLAAVIIIYVYARQPKKTLPFLSLINQVFIRNQFTTMVTAVHDLYQLLKKENEAPWPSNQEL